MGKLLAIPLVFIVMFAGFGYGYSLGVDRGYASCLVNTDE